MSYPRSRPIEQPTPSARAAKASFARITLARRVEFLSGLPLFAGLPKRQVTSIARITETIRFAPGQEIVIEGARGDFCFMLVEGAAEVVREGALVARLGPGEVFGELALLDPGPRSATVRSMTEVVAIRIEREALEKVITTDPRIALRMLQVLARRLRVTTAELN